VVKVVGNEGTIAYENKVSPAKACLGQAFVRASQSFLKAIAPSLPRRRLPLMI